MKCIIEVEVDVDSEETAHTWMLALLETAFTKPNPEPRPQGLGLHMNASWKMRVPLPPNEHPYRPRVLRARKA
jgi:hypothetical protein